MTFTEVDKQDFEKLGSTVAL